MNTSMSSMPRTEEPATVEQVLGVIEEYKKRRAAFQESKRREGRLAGQLPVAQRAVAVAREEHERAKRAYSTALSSEESRDLLTLRAACDAAEVTAFDKKREAQIVMDAHRSVQEKLEEENKALTEALLAIQELARRCLKTTWNRNTLWASGHESEATWRGSMLGAMLGRLPNGNFEETLDLIEVLLRGSKFRAKVQRGFWHAGTSSDDRKCFQAGEELSIPKGLNYQVAFEELLGGRLQLVREWASR